MCSNSVKSLGRRHALLMQKKAVHVPAFDMTADEEDSVHICQ